MNVSGGKVALDAGSVAKLVETYIIVFTLILNLLPVSVEQILYAAKYIDLQLYLLLHMYAVSAHAMHL